MKSIGAMNYSVHLGIYKKGGDRTIGVLASKSTEVRGSNKSSGSHAKNAVDVGTDEEVIQNRNDVYIATIALLVVLDLTEWEELCVHFWNPQD